MAGKLNHSNFASSIPIGVEPPAGYLQRLQKAMGDARGRKRGKYVDAVQIWYLLGSKAIEQAIGKDRTTVWRWKNRGEAILMETIDS